ncbi:MAG: Rieske 2Fe-2S domain-containing protein [Sandaracinaceae bacterium]|nr:Rieske 2Fe-2S domain-containing protein [Sandaracinaceae bacterium]
MHEDEDRWCDVGAAEELARRELSEVKIGRAKIALTYKEGAFSAISGLCNHVGGPLGKGRLDGEYVVCPWHNWKFHRATGEGEPGFEEDRVPAHAVKVEGGRVLVRATALTTRNKKPHDPHPLSQLRPRGAPGGPGQDDPCAWSASRPR